MGLMNGGTSGDQRFRHLYSERELYTKLPFTVRAAIQGIRDAARHVIPYLSADDFVSSAVKALLVGADSALVTSADASSRACEIGNASITSRSVRRWVARHSAFPPGATAFVCPY